MGFFAGDADDAAASTSRLEPVDAFGDNPGALRMLAYAPPRLRPGAALVVVLHGCGQDAEDFARGAGWMALAEKFGFALLCPEQTGANNRGRCFNWFRPKDIAADGGEAESIRQMVLHLVHGQRLDPKRVFVVGLSAGGAMALAMLATAPALFAGGAVFAGMAYGAASGIGGAMLAMTMGSHHSPRLLGDQVRRAAPGHAAPWPRLSVWQGQADTTVSPSNAGQIVAQWLDVLALSPTPTRVDRQGPRMISTWEDAAGRAQLELNIIEGMGHGAPVAGDGTAEGGRPGPYLIDTGIVSALSIVQFWGLAKERDVEPAPVAPFERLEADAPAAETPRARASVGAKLRAFAGRALRGIGLKRGA